MDFKKYFSSRKFRYGAISVVMTVAFIAVVLLANVLLTVLGNKFSLYADMTAQEFYTVSKESEEQLSGISAPVEIVFFQKSEDIKEPSQSSSALGYVKYLAEEYGRKFDFVSVKYVDMLQSPAAANAYKKTSSDNIRTDSVVISCPATGKQKIVQLKGFFTFDSNGSVYAFNGEKRITSCILQVASGEKPKAYFTTGHNEYIGYTDSSTGSTQYTYMLDMLSEQGYEIGTVDLLTQDIPNDADLVIINCPATDFAGAAAQQAGGTNEIEKIKNYIQKDYGNVMLVLSQFSPDLPELRELLEENFGISYTAQTVLTDNTSNTVGNDGARIIAKPCGTQESFEYQMHKYVSEKGMKIIAPYSVSMKIIGSDDKYVVPVLALSESGMVMSVDAGDYENAPGTPIVALSSKISYDSNNNEKRGNLLVVGSMYMFEGQFAAESTYGNADFFYGILKSFGNSSVTVDIPTKPFNDDYLDVTKKQANTLTAVTVALLPVIILAAGVIVWYRRKSK